MSKGKARKGKQAKRRTGAHKAVDVMSAPPVSTDGSVKPTGQRLYDMPYSATAPKLINPDLGLRNLVRAGHNAGYDIDVTLLEHLTTGCRSGSYSRPDAGRSANGF